VVNGIANRSLKSTIDPLVYQFVLHTIVAHVGTVLYRTIPPMSDAEALVFFDQLVTILDQGMRYQLRK
jgi:hypothetical protein